MKQLSMKIQIRFSFKRIVGHSFPDPDVVLVSAVPTSHVSPRVFPLVLSFVRPVSRVLVVQTFRFVLALSQLVTCLTGTRKNWGRLSISLLRVNHVELIPAVRQVGPWVVVMVINRVASFLAGGKVGVGVGAEFVNIRLVTRSGTAELSDGFEHFKKFSAEITAVVRGCVLLAPLLHSCYHGNSLI